MISRMPWIASSPPVPSMAAPSIFCVSCVRHDFHEALRLVLFHGSADAGHRPLGNQQWPARLACLRLCQAYPSERRIDIERIAEDTIAHFAVLSVKEICCNDLEIIVSRVSKGTAPVAVADCPDAGYICLS